MVDLAVGRHHCLVRFGVASRRRDGRAQFTVHIAEAGQATFQMTPGNPSDEDLSLLALCYAAKLRWLLLTEHERIQEVFQGLCREAIDFWTAPGSDLIDRMPSARRFREDESPVNHPRLVAQPAVIGPVESNLVTLPT